MLATVARFQPMPRRMQAGIDAARSDQLDAVGHRLRPPLRLRRGRSVVNLAARLCAEALGGQLLLSERAHRMVEDPVEAEALAPLHLKGFHQPTPAYNGVPLRAGSELAERST